MQILPSGPEPAARQLTGHDGISGPADQAVRIGSYHIRLLKGDSEGGSALSPDFNPLAPPSEEAAAAATK